METGNIPVAYEGLSLMVSYEYHPGCRNTATSPAEPDEVVISSVTQGDGHDILPLLSDRVITGLEDMVIDLVDFGNGMGDY